jgi:hypothetical protein
MERVVGDRVVILSKRRTLFFARRRARLSLELRSSSMMRFSYGARLQACEVSRHSMSHCPTVSGRPKCNVPSNLTGDLTNEGSALR